MTTDETCRYHTHDSLFFQASIWNFFASTFASRNFHGEREDAMLQSALMRCKFINGLIIELRTRLPADYQDRKVGKLPLVRTHKLQRAIKASAFGDDQATL